MFHRPQSRTLAKDRVHDTTPPFALRACAGTPGLLAHVLHCPYITPRCHACMCRLWPKRMRLHVTRSLPDKPARGRTRDQKTKSLFYGHAARVAFNSMKQQAHAHHALLRASEVAPNHEGMRKCTTRPSGKLRGPTLRRRLRLAYHNWPVATLPSVHGGLGLESAERTAVRRCRRTRCL